MAEVTSYLRPDDGVADEAEMVEIAPHRTMRRDTAIALGLWAPPVPLGSGRGGTEFRAAASADRASEVVGGFEGDCSATVLAEITLPGADRVSQPPVDASKPVHARPRNQAGRPSGPQCRDSRKDGTPPEAASAPPAVSAPKRKPRSVKSVR